MDKIEKALLKAKHAGAQEERERILSLIRGAEPDIKPIQLLIKLKSELEVRK